MSVIYIIMLALYGILFFLSRKEKAAPDPSSARIDNLFSKAAEYVVRRAESISIKPGSVRTDSYIAQHDISRKKKLNILNPAIPAEKQMHDIRTDIAKKVLVIIFFGTVISLMICLSQIFGGIIEEGNIIQRNTYEGGGKDVELVAGIDGTEESISYTVGEREYTEKELDTLFETLSEKPNNYDTLIGLPQPYLFYNDPLRENYQELLDKVTHIIKLNIMNRGMVLLESKYLRIEIKNVSIKFVPLTKEEILTTPKVGSLYEFNGKRQIIRYILQHE